MITEQELKDQCTPEFIKCMCELAEGFDYQGDNEIFYNSLRVDRNIFLFPLLIHRAVEGWNNKHLDDDWSINISSEDVSIPYWNCGEQELRVLKQFKNYQPQSLTQCECAMLHCLLDIFKEERR